MEKIVIYGCGKVGKMAYEFFKDTYEIAFFVDRKVRLCGVCGGGESSGDTGQRT